MKVNIGSYLTWFGPYQLAELFEPIIGEDKSYAFGEWLSGTFIGSWLTKYHSTKKRKVSVRIDHYDVWNMDSTMTMVILPLLYEYKKQNESAPYTDDSDVPEHIRSTVCPAETEYDTDKFFHHRWEWIVEEIIWTFEKLHPDCRDDIEACIGYEDRIKNGLRLFGKYYRAFWT